MMKESGVCKAGEPVSDTGSSAHGRSISWLPGAVAYGVLVFQQDSIYLARWAAGSNPAMMASHVAKWV